MQLALDLLLDPTPSLDNFIVGSNQELIQHLRQPPSSNIFLWGESGCGKTHLLKALANQQGLYLQADGLISVDSLNLPMTLCIDDLENISPENLDIVFALQNAYRASSNKLLLIASRIAPKSIANHLDTRVDVSSRLAWGLTLQIKDLSDEHKQHALAAFFTHRGTEISEDVIPYLLTRHSRNIKDLASLADTIDRYAFTQKRALTLALVRQFQSQNGI